MGIFDKLGNAMGSSSKGINIEDYMNSAEMEDVDVLHEPADMYIKPVTANSESDAELIQEEISKGNIILLDISELNKRPTTRNNIISKLKTYCDKVNGDIGQIDETRVLLTPSKVKIIKRKKSSR
ncbi:MAG: cell division protein SepF [Candidatus Micrarchaeaceae archaeon]